MGNKLRALRILIRECEQEENCDNCEVQVICEGMGITPIDFKHNYPKILKDGE